MIENMNTKLKLLRIVAAATFGSLLWVGCASPKSDYAATSPGTAPLDLTKRRPDTHPELSLGLDRSQTVRTVVDIPWDSDVLNEAAGSERRRH